MKFLTALLITIMLSGVSFAQTDIAQHLQDVSVTIKAPSKYGGESQGSGVIITRLVKKDKDAEPTKVNFVWTAAHVVDDLRTVRSVIDPKTGTTKKIIEFKPAFIVKELTENGRRVGELKLEVSVIKFSDADDGEDLALLMVRKRDFVEFNAEFYINSDDGETAIVPVGTQLFHVGSLLGQMGANSMTDGIVSQIGRVINLGNGGNTAIFDQTTVTAFPGSSGGGVFLATQDDHRGKYMGMLVRGAGETFNLVVPVRRMHEWAKNAGVEWAIDSSVEMPTLKELKKMSVEDIGVAGNWSTQSRGGEDENPHSIDAGSIGGIDLQYRIGFTRTEIIQPNSKK